VWKAEGWAWLGRQRIDGPYETRHEKIREYKKIEDKA
jgi:hypothetical protein